MGVPLTDLLQEVKDRSGHDELEQDWLDVILKEAMAYLLAGPAACKKATWLTWDDLPDAIQAIIVGALARHGSMGLGTISEERIGDYSVRYADPSLFEGRIPRFYNDGEELGLSKLSGCAGSLYSVSVPGTPIHNFTEPENSQPRGALPYDFVKYKGWL